MTVKYYVGSKIPANDTMSQPYQFDSVITMLNHGRDELKSWRVFVKFVHQEILVSASNDLRSENGTVFAGYPSSDLKSAIQTEGDATQMQARVESLGLSLELRQLLKSNLPTPETARKSLSCKCNLLFEDLE